MRQQIGPAQSRLGIPRDTVNATGDIVEPMLERATPTPRWQQKDPEADFSQDHRIDGQVAFGTRQPFDHPRIRPRLGRFAQYVGIHEIHHGGHPRESVDSDSIGTNQPFSGHARSVFNSPWFFGGSAITRRYSPLSNRSIANDWPGSSLS